MILVPRGSGMPTAVLGAFSMLCEWTTILEVYKSYIGVAADMLISSPSALSNIPYGVCLMSPD